MTLFRHTQRALTDSGDVIACDVIACDVIVRDVTVMPGCHRFRLVPIRTEETDDESDIVRQYNTRRQRTLCVP